MRECIKVKIDDITQKDFDFPDLFKEYLTAYKIENPQKEREKKRESTSVPSGWVYGFRNAAES